MEYNILKDKIIVNTLNEFDIHQILNCGQFFRFKEDNKKYIVYSLDKKAVVYKNFDKYIIQTNDTKYFETFFNLKTNYTYIKENLNKKYPFLNEFIKSGEGIRILKQDLVETTLSFIISANNNIKRIQKIIEKICETCGKKVGDFYAFPTLKEMEKLDEQFFKNIGAGYRANYLYQTIQFLIKNPNHLTNLDKLPTNLLKNELIKLKGVGPKVADCIMLFGYNRFDVFPVDTWIQKFYNKFLDKNEINRVKIRENLVNMFKEYSGIVQQYVFYYARENKIS